MKLRLLIFIKNMLDNDFDVPFFPALVCGDRLLMM